MAARPPGSRLAQRPGEQVGELGSERGFALLAGGALIALGLAGSFGNPFVGRPEATSLIVTGPGHDIIHLVVGALYLHVAVVLSGRQRSAGLLGLGGSLALSGALSLLVPDLLGLYGLATSGLDQVAHVALGAASVAIGWFGRGGHGRRAASASGRGHRPRRRGA